MLLYSMWATTNWYYTSLIGPSLITVDTSHIDSGNTNMISNYHNFVLDRIQILYYLNMLNLLNINMDIYDSIRIKYDA
jgi:hypothetical protein